MAKEGRETGGKWGKKGRGVKIDEKYICPTKFLTNLYHRGYRKEQMILLAKKKVEKNEKNKVKTKITELSYCNNQQKWVE